MKYYFEAWKARQTWLDMGQEARGAYMAQLGPAIQQLGEQGAEIITWGVNDAETFNRLDQEFFAIWKFPTEELANQFEELVNGAGWYNYFHQVNIKGSPATPTDIIGKLITM
jgi:hypothetical protein